jgi:hypothetical protein
MKAGHRSWRAARMVGQAAGFPPLARWAGDLAGPRRSRPSPGPGVWQHGDVSMQIPSPEPRLTADDYLGAAPDARGDIEVVDGLVVHNMAQSEVHDLVVRRLAAALENARAGRRALLPRQLRRGSAVR